MTEYMKSITVKEWNALNRKVRHSEKQLSQIREEMERVLEHLDILGKTLMIPSGKRLGS